MASWPPGFKRIPDEPWTQQPVDDFAVGYDRLGRHGWYANLDPLLPRVEEATPDGGLLVDYSGGTGLLIDRLRKHGAARGACIVNVDASAKFLRLCMDKHGHDPLVAMRLLRYVPEIRRLESLDEVLGATLLGRVDVLACANAVHLYYDLAETMAAWRRVLRPGGRVFVQSGNIRGPAPGPWIIDATVHEIARVAETVVREQSRFARYRAVLADRARMEAHEALRRRYFLPARPLGHYLDALRGARFTIDAVEHRTIGVDVAEWIEFLGVYHDGILGWMGGSEKIEGTAAGPEAVEDRLEALAEAARHVFPSGRFDAQWTYIDARAT